MLVRFLSMKLNCSLNLIEEISMAYLDVDKDIRYYTDPLEERIDELEGRLKTQMQDVDDELMTLTNQITGLLALLKTVGD